jgi:CPA1 family monovalent cation:H+ antiporter
MERYRSRLDQKSTDADEGRRIRDTARAEREFRIIALRAERHELYRLRRAGDIDDGVHRRLVGQLDLIEASLSHAA